MQTGTPRQPRTTAKHEELTRTLLDLLDTLQPGDRFPSQTELMRRYQVSDRTVLRSLDDLRQAGRIVRRHGIGTFVAEHANGFVPQAPAPLRVGTQTIAGLSTSLTPFYRHNIERMTEIAARAGLSFLCQHVCQPVQFEDALPLEALHPRGFILFTHIMMPVAIRLLERGQRVVVVGTPPVDTVPEAPSICGDQQQGGYLATRYLLDQGHRRIAFVDQSEPNATLPYPFPLLQRPRWRGHQEALAEAEVRGLTVTATLLGKESVNKMHADPEEARRFFGEPSAPTALVCLNDTAALRMLGLLTRAGIRVPEDVSLIGYDNLPESADCHPPLTTVEPFTDTQLRTALDLLTRPVPPPNSYTVVIPPVLKERATVAPPHAS
jgi:DNA-binding LacI/PurR family transcriptional regulator